MTTPAIPEYRDRRTGLVIFGIFEMLIGLFCACIIPLMMIAQTIASRRPGAPAAPPPMGMIFIIYGLLAVAFIWVGVGSMLARRWARAIVLCASAVTLCGGLIAAVLMPFFLPHLGEIMARTSPTALPPGAILGTKIGVMVVIFLIFILIPGSLFLFYRSPHVKRTCEVRDPVERWTDRCPLPVLAFSLMKAFGGISMVGMAFSLHVYPLFGLFVSGVAGAALMALVGLLILWVALGMYRLRLCAWWAALGLQAILLISNLITFWRGGMEAYYLKAGFDPRMAHSSGQMFAQPTVRWMVVIPTFFAVAWLLWIRRYFLAPIPAAAPDNGSQAGS